MWSVSLCTFSSNTDQMLGDFSPYNQPFKYMDLFCLEVTNNCFSYINFLNFLYLIRFKIFLCAYVPQTMSSAAFQISYVYINLISSQIKVHMFACNPYFNRS